MSQGIRRESKGPGTRRYKCGWHKEFKAEIRAREDQKVFCWQEFNIFCLYLFSGYVGAKTWVNLTNMLREGSLM